MGKSPSLFIVTMASMFAACVPSVYPLYTDRDLRFDPALVGTWAEEADAHESWTFEKAGDDSYTLTVKDGEKSGRFDAHLVQLGKYRFLDIVPDDDTLEQVQLPDIYTASLIHGHMFLKVDQIEPRLQMAFLDPNWLGPYLREHPTDLAHRGGCCSHRESDLVLLAETRHLQAFMMEHADDKGAFGDRSDFRRVK